MQRLNKYIRLTAAAVMLMAMPQSGTAEDTLVMAMPQSGTAQDTPGTAQDTAATAQDTAATAPLRFSLLTCTPGTDVYAHFGHTAILMDDGATGRAVVYNYGCFDSSQDHFVMNFVKGDTNYMLEEEPLQFFLWRYGQMGNGVTEQQLNLTASEALRLKALLAENVKPVNQTYLYNWLYDNCTERARDIIEQAVEGQIVYEGQERTVTARQMLHEKLVAAPWLRLGIDLLLGQEIDTLAPRRLQMFIPNAYQAEIDSATIVAADGTRRPLVSQSRLLLAESSRNREVPSPFKPAVMFGLLLAGILLQSAYDIMHRKLTLWLDVALHTVQGLAGVLIAYLFCFSKHPAVDSNWQVILLNPLFLGYAIWLAVVTLKGKTNTLATANLAVTAVFLLLMLAVPQSFNPSVWLVALILLARAITQTICKTTYTKSNS